MLLGPACSTVIAVVGTKSSLTSDAIVARKAATGAGGTVACPFVGALDPRMEIVGIHHVSDPSEVLRAGALTSPFRLTIQTCEVQAVVVELAGAVVGAVVLAEAALTVSSLVESYLTPSLGRVGRSSGGIVAWLRGGLRGRLG